MTGTSLPLFESSRSITAFSPQSRARQATSSTVKGASRRIPVLAQNRAYLKALRQAELAAWEAVGPRMVAPARCNSASVRLPAPVRDAREGWLYVLLSVMCLALIGYELWAKSNPRAIGLISFNLSANC
jgi:hypothetical protein